MARGKLLLFSTRASAINVSVVIHLHAADVAVCEAIREWYPSPVETYLSHSLIPPSSTFDLGAYSAPDFPSNPCSARRRVVLARHLALASPCHAQAQVVPAEGPPRQDGS